jgi:hypothetical protein
MRRLQTILLALLLASGCAEREQAPAPAAAESAAPAKQEVFTLNAGERWQVDEHTRTSVARIEAVVAKGGDHTALSDAIEAELRALVKGCTMTGPGHDQLHVFLAHIFPLVKALKTDGAAAALTGIGDLMGAYHAAFE